jgi:hypothetical protein
MNKLKRAVEESKRALNPRDVVETFELTSRVKTAGGNSFNQGFPVGYAVNGIETPEINVIAGKTYKFVVKSACNHPFYLTTDSRGRGRAPMEVGFDIAPAKSNPLICAGESILWKPSEALIGKDIWYHCTIHDNMGWFVRVKKQSFCDKYTALPFKNNKDLVTTVVDAVIDRVVAPTSRVLEYFDGTLGLTNFTAPGNAAKTVALRDSLVNFFGVALGCADGSIPAYTGGGMKEVHASMAISGVEYDFFNQQIIDVLETAGVSPEDRKFVLDLLNSADVRGAICNFGDNCFDSLCTKYSKALNVTNKALIDTVVNAAFGAVTASAIQKPFFDGTKPPGSTNFFADSAKLTKLKNDFGAFLGRADVLGCTDPKFPAANIDIPGLKALHASMPIDPTVFNGFNDDVIKGITPLGLAAADLIAIRKLLNSTEPLICNQPGCSAIANDAVKAFDLSVAAKVAGHHYFGQGFPSAFKIDGQTVEGLVLEAGKTYAFKASQGCLHPFYFSNGTGAGSPDFENGIAAADVGQVFCNGKVLTFTPQTADIGKSLFYVCKNHNFMGGRLCIVQPGQTNTPCTVGGVAPPPPSTPCDELVAAVKTKVAGTANAATFKDANTILSKVVVDLFLFGIGSQQAPGALRKYFDGTFPVGSRDFIGNMVNQGNLVTGLVKFFGTKLGCSDNSITPYAKPTDEPNMKTVHQFMDIKQAEFDAFNTKLVDFLTNFAGLNAGLSANSAKTVRVFLNTTSTDICAECGNFQPPSICEKWTIAAKAKSQVDLIQGAVLAVFNNLTAAGSPARDFFNGKVPCQSRNFIDGRLDQAGLAKSLIAYFGQPTVLGCSDANFPQYRGNNDMEDVHKEMPITKALFDQFLSALADYATVNLKAAVGATFDEDLGKVAAFFATDNVAKTCNQPGCPKQGKFVVRDCGNIPGQPTTTTTTTVEGTTTAAGTDGTGTDGTTTGTGTGTTGDGTTGAPDTDSAVLPSVAAFVVAACVAMQL